MTLNDSVICSGIYARVYCILVRVQCHRKESSRSLSHLLMSFLLNTTEPQDNGASGVELSPLNTLTYLQDNSIQASLYSLPHITQNSANCTVNSTTGKAISSYVIRMRSLGSSVLDWPRRKYPSCSPPPMLLIDVVGTYTHDFISAPLLIKVNTVPVQNEWVSLQFNVPRDPY